jgi:hypothetical protein
LSLRVLVLEELAVLGELGTQVRENLVRIRVRERPWPKGFDKYRQALVPAAVPSSAAAAIVDCLG